MKKVFKLLLISFGFIVSSCKDDNPGQSCNCGSPYDNIREYTTIDPSNPDYYSDPFLPDHFGLASNTDNTPTDNPITDEGASLGRVLFYDVELSVNRTISCATCHIQSLGFTDSAQFSVGFEGGVTAFHSMRLVNSKFYAPGLQFWDRRAGSIEEQSTQPIQDHIEMGFDADHGGMAALIQRMNALPYYPELFEWAFGDPAITEERMQKALAQFVRSMNSTHSRFDDGYAQNYDPNIPGTGLLQDFANFSEQENVGKTLFMTPVHLGGAGCNACHQAPAFTMDGPVLSNGINAGETVIFKSPSLKDVALTGPYMHGGQIPDLMGVIEHYNSGIQDGPALDPLLRDPVTNGPLRMNLTSRQKNALVAFLLTLNDPEITTDPKFSDPFRN